MDIFELGLVFPNMMHIRKKKNDNNNNNCEIVVKLNEIDWISSSIFNLLSVMHYREKNSVTKNER